MKKEKYFLPTGERRFDFKIPIITGACRSGKTLIGRLLGSLENVEYMDEPWLPTVLPMLQGNNLIDPKISKDIFRSYIEEFMNDVILLRQANFRPQDQSSIWDRKDISEIFDRLVKLHSRDDVRKYIKRANPTLLLNLPEIMPFLPFLTETFPGCKVIHIVRNGLDVALEVRKKKWFTNKLLKQPFSNYYLFRKYYSKKYLGNYYMPYWIKDNEDGKFLNMTDFAKGLYYWRRIVEASGKPIKKFKTDFLDEYREVRFESIIESPTIAFDELSTFLNVSVSKKTETILSSIKKLKPIRKYPVNEISKDERNKTNKLLSKLKYPTF